MATEEASAPYPFLRLVKLASDVLPRNKTVAIIDGRHGGVSIGRDKTFTARLRLPSMEVSKHHANIFSNTRGPIYYSISDTGSMHGTYVCRRGKPTAASALAAVPTSQFVRLSEAKHASTPYDLQHWDLIRIGVQSTTFEVHLHSSPWEVCDKCAVKEDGTNEISVAPLAQPSRPAASSTQADAIPSSHPSRHSRWQVEQDRRKRLRALKHAILPMPDKQAATTAPPSSYRDRAAVRRTMQPPSSVPRSQHVSDTIPTTPSKPLDAQHVGYQMLARMAKESDTTMPTQAPVVPRVATGRAGLGSTGLLDAETYGQGPSHARYQAQGRAAAQKRYEQAAMPPPPK